MFDYQHLYQNHITMSNDYSHLGPSINYIHTEGEGGSIPKKGGGKGVQILYSVDAFLIL